MIIKAALSTLCYEVGMRNVNWVVNAEANGEDDADAGGHVDGHLPEVEEPDDVDQGQRHARQHHHADLWGNTGENKQLLRGAMDTLTDRQSYLWKSCLTQIDY